MVCIFPLLQPRFVSIKIADRFGRNKLCSFGTIGRYRIRIKDRGTPDEHTPATKFENGTSPRTKYQFAIELLPWTISIIMFGFCCVISRSFYRRFAAKASSSSIFNRIVLARNVRVRKLFSAHEVRSSVIQCVIIGTTARGTPAHAANQSSKPFRSSVVASNTCVGNHRSTNAYSFHLR